MNYAKDYYFGNSATARAKKTKTASRTARRVYALDAETQRRRRGAERQTQVSACGDASNAFLKVSFLPVLQRTKTVQACQDISKMEKDFYSSLDSLAEHYHIVPLEKDIGNVEDDRASIEQLTTTGLENLLKLGEAFDGGTLADSREIIGLIFPENFTFSENKIRTARVNEIINCIYLVNNRLRAKKNGTKDDIFLLSRVVTSTGFKPVTS
jgi:hypothetical protein